MLTKKSAFARFAPAIICTPLLAFALVACAPEEAPIGEAANEQGSATEPDSTDTEGAEEQQPVTQEETCDWDSPKLTGAADVPKGQDGDLAEVLVGSWQHTHTDEGSGFEEVVNDHRYVFPSPNRMLYCQHVPGVTEHAENAGDVVLNGTAIELPGGQYEYTITAWDQDTIVWDNPIGGGYVYLLQRR